MIFDWRRESKGLKRREKLFARMYVELGSDTRYNAYQSAQKAGYAEKTALTRAHKLLERVGIKELIDKYEDALFVECTKDREEKARIAYEMFVNAPNEKAKQFWWDQHGQLSGHYVQKHEIDQKITFTDEEKGELDVLKRRLDGVSSSN